MGAAPVLLTWLLLFVCLCSRLMNLPSPGATSLTLALRRFSVVRSELSLYRPDCETNFVEAKTSLGSDFNWAQLLEDPLPYLKSKFFSPNSSYLAGIWETSLVHQEPFVGRCSFWLHWCDTSNPVSYSMLLSSSVTLPTGSDCCDVSAIRRPRLPTRGRAIFPEKIVSLVDRYSFWLYWCETSNPVSCPMPLSSSVTLANGSDCHDGLSPLFFSVSSCDGRNRRFLFLSLLDYITPSEV